MAKEGAVLTIDPAQLVSMMFALLPVPVAITDSRGRVILCNSCFTDYFQCIASMPTEPQREVEIPGRGTFQVQTLPLTDQGYKIVFATDVSEQTRMRRRIGRLEKMAAIGRVVTGVANELETPLADIASYTLLAEKENLTAEVRQILGAVLTKAERAAHLVQSLTVIGGITAPRSAPFDLNKVVRNVVELRRSRHEKACDVMVELDESLPKALGDPSLIEQVVLTLLMNAEDSVAGSANGSTSIDIRTCTRNGRIQLHVSNNGFARDGSRVLELAESGVGLNICAEIAKDHGGDLYAWNSNGSGATVTLELPVCTQEADANSGRRLKGKTVLVVDDEVHITEFIQEVLTRHGALVEIAHSGSEAFDCFKSQPHDLVICDRHMPGLSGQRLYRLIQDLDPHARRRFLFLIGDPVPAGSRAFFSEHGVHFLRKPFKVQDLLETIDDLFTRNQSQDF